MTADFAGAFTIDGARAISSWDLAIDGAGNTCVVGRFAETVDFDPGEGVYQLTSRQDAAGAYLFDIFAAKYDPAGNLLWAQRMGGSGANFGPEITAASDGSVYVAGSFTGSADFGATTLTSFGAEDAFVTKLDANGNFMWARRFGGTRADYGNDVAVDATGNVYVMAETRTAPSGNPDAFFAKLDAAGNALWTTAVGASSSTTTKGKNTTTTGWARGFKLEVDAAGGVYATGRMSGTVDFDPTAGAATRAGDAFVMKLTTTGRLAWASTFVADLSVEPHDIAVAANGNVYSTGRFTRPVDFDPGTSKSQKFILNPGADLNGTWNAGTYISALKPDGSFLWAKSTQSVGGLGYAVIPEAMSLDASGAIYLTGYFSGTADFNPGTGAYSLTSAGGDDAFVWKLNPSGDFAWAGQIAGSATEFSRGTAVDSAGAVYLSGAFSGTADFDPGPGVYELTGTGDMFVLKLVQQSLPAALSASVETSSPSLSESRSLAIDLALEEADDSVQRHARRHLHRGWRI